MYFQALPKDPLDGGRCSAATDSNLQRFSDNMAPFHNKYKQSFERDFIVSKPNLSQLCERFRIWRDRLEILLDHRPQKLFLEHFSHYLAEFEFQKFEEIEVPGQYLLV